MKSDPTRHPAERARLRLEALEGRIEVVARLVEPAPGDEPKAEACVVERVTEQKDGGPAHGPRLDEGRSHERMADAPALVLGQNAEWGESGRGQCSSGALDRNLDHDRGQGGVPDGSIVPDRDQTEEGGGASSQGPDEARVLGSTEGPTNDGIDLGEVGGGLASDEERGLDHRETARSDLLGWSGATSFRGDSRVSTMSPDFC